MDRILVIDDNTVFLNDLERLLQDRYSVVTATTGKRGLEVLQKDHVNAVLLDLRLPDMAGEDVLQTIHRDIDPLLPVIVITEANEPERIVQCMRFGAYDYIPKSFHRDILSAKLLKALERRALEVSVHALQRNIAEHHDKMVFVSNAMRRINFEITRLALLPFDVLLTGETGVGKDFVAFELHRRSPRRDHPFVSLAMRSLSESIIESELFGHEKGAFSGADRTRIGRIEAATGGTLYIPEISSLTEIAQLKLLQFLQYKSIARVGQDSRRPDTKIDVRIVMATNESLEEQVQKGHMRSDFYHRVAGITLNLPPLRERPDDISPLAEYFLEKHSSYISSTRYSFSQEVIQALTSYSWPGNVRELENAVKNALAYSSDPVLQLDSFPLLQNRAVIASRCSHCLHEKTTLLPHKAAEEEFRRAYFQEALQRAGNNFTQAAQAAGMTVQGFRRAVRILGFRPRK